MACDKGKLIQNQSTDGVPRSPNRGYVTPCMNSPKCGAGYTLTPLSQFSCFWPGQTKIQCDRDWKKVMTEDRKQECCDGTLVGIQYCSPEYCKGSTKCKPYIKTEAPTGPTGPTDSNSSAGTGSTDSKDDSNSDTTLWIIGGIVTAICCLICMAIIVFFATQKRRNLRYTGF